MVLFSWKKLASTIAICSCATEVAAKIEGFTAPASVPAGKDALVQLTIWGYVQNWQDYSIIWAWSPSDDPPYPGEIGVVSYYGPEWPVVFTDLLTAYQNSTGEAGYGSYWVNVTTPSDPGSYILSGAVTYVVGHVSNLRIADYHAFLASLGRFYRGLRIVARVPSAARPSVDAVKRDLHAYEEGFINRRSYKHHNATVKLVGCKKIPVPDDAVDAFEEGWYTNLHEYEKLGRHFYDESSRELRAYFPVENALVEHEGLLLEANELGEFELEELDGDYAVLGRYQTDAIRGVDSNIIEDGIIYLAKKVKPYRKVGNVYFYDFGYKDVGDHDHDGDLKARCDELNCPNQGCVKNHGGENCSKKFGYNHGRCTFRTDVCMDFNGYFTDCVRPSDAAGRILRFPGSDCDESLYYGHCYNEAASFDINV